MQDMQAHLEKLHVQIAECEMIRDLATDPAKRQLFAKLAEHFKVLVSEVEKAIAGRTPDTFSASEPAKKE
jgi:hypothetical protein